MFISRLYLSVTRLLLARYPSVVVCYSSIVVCYPSCACLYSSVYTRLSLEGSFRIDPGCYCKLETNLQVLTFQTVLTQIIFTFLAMVRFFLFFVPEFTSTYITCPTLHVWVRFSWITFMQSVSMCCALVTLCTAKT